MIILFGLAGLCFTMFLIFSKQVILRDEIFYVKGIFGKNNKYPCKNIIRADLKQNDGVVIHTLDDKKFKIDVQMTNFDWLLNELHNKKIPIFINGVKVED